MRAKKVKKIAGNDCCPLSASGLLMSGRKIPDVAWLIIMLKGAIVKRQTSFNRFLSMSKSATESTDFIIAVGMKSTKHDMNAAAKVRSEFI